MVSYTVIERYLQEMIERENEIKKSWEEIISKSVLSDTEMLIIGYQAEIEKHEYMSKRIKDVLIFLNSIKV